MPPRIRPVNTLPGRFVSYSSSRPVLPFLAPALQLNSPAPLQRASDVRFASILNDLRANPGEHHKAIKRGRGPSSGKGKTSGRGHKGQKQHGKVPKDFEGGQTPLIVVKGKRGFVNVHSEDYNIVPLSRIRSWVAQGRLDPTKPITVRELAISGCVNNIKDGVKLLANSKSHDVSIDELPPFTQPLTIVVSRASKQAIEAVEAVGGRVLTRYYTNWAIKKIIEGKMDPINSILSIGPDGVTPADKQAEALATDQPVDVATGAPVAPWATPALPIAKYAYRLPDATSRKAMEYYRDSAKRGYLSYQVKEGQNPSLFFRDIAHESNFGKFAKGAKDKSKKDEHDKMF